MTRRNRRKVHRELRLRAEARKAQLCARRQLRRQREEALQTSIRTASARRARPTRSRPVSLDLLTGINQLLSLADTPSVLCKQVNRVLRCVARQIPDLARTTSLPWLILLSTEPWARSPERFVAPSGSTHAKQDALARHLFAHFRVPPFLLSALDFEPLALARAPMEDAWGVKILATLGRGESLRSLVGTEALPAPLTRRMCHLMVSATAEHSVVGALRRAQVVGFGGSPLLARKLLNTRLGSLRGSDRYVGEAFWHRIIGWLSARPEFESGKVSKLSRVLAWFEMKQRKGLASGTQLSLTGRTATSVQRAADHWFELHHRPASPDVFPSSGLLPSKDGTYQLAEIADEAQLRAEGQAMRNCAYSYRKLIHKGKVALFSLMQEGASEAMVEVSLGAMRVVQAKQACNRRCTSSQLAAVRRWAIDNRLKMTL